MVAIGNRGRGVHSHRSDGAVGYDDGNHRELHEAGSHEVVGGEDDRSIHPKGKDDVQVVGSENGRSDRYVGSRPEAIEIGKSDERSHFSSWSTNISQAANGSAFEIAIV